MYVCVAIELLTSTAEQTVTQPKQDLRILIVAVMARCENVRGMHAFALRIN